MALQTHVIAKTVIVDPDGRILVLRRSEDDAHRPGGSDFPGGQVNPGEAIMAGAAREVLEEAGLRLDNQALNLLFATTKVGYQSEVGTDINFVWLGLVARLPKGQTVKLSHEHQSYSWLAFDEALAECDGPTHKLFLQHLKQYNLLADYS